MEFYEGNFSSLLFLISRLASDIIRTKGVIYIKLIDITGQKFNKLTVISYEGYNKKWNASMWKCVCDCGKEVLVGGQYLKRGLRKSCGCIRKGIGNGNYKHGHSHESNTTPEYRSWAAMVTRCTNENQKHYMRYGGRGITVCDRWKNSFEDFLSDMGPKSSPKHSIDRIDYNGNYEPSNCRWANAIEQGRNKGHQKNNKSGIKGVFSKGNKWVAQITVDRKKMFLGSFDEKNDAAEARANAERYYWNGTKGEI